MVLPIQNGVLIGNEGQLFLAGGRHAPFTQANLSTEIVTALSSTFFQNIRDRQKVASAMGCDYIHAVFPDKHTVLPSLAGLDSGFIGLAAQVLAKAEPWDAHSVIFLLPALSKLNATGFIATDTHVSAEGAAACATEIARSIGMAISDEDVEILQTARGPEVQCYGDLGSKLEPTKSVTIRHFKPTWPVEVYSNRLMGGNDGIIDIWQSGSPRASGRVLLFGDSFLRACLPALSYYFEEMLFLRSRFLHEEMLWMYRPDCVITANVERYLGNVSRDSEAPIFLLYPGLNGVASEPSEGFAATLNRILSCGRERKRALASSG